jgi:hypothetical protein
MTFENNYLIEPNFPRENCGPWTLPFPVTVSDNIVITGLADVPMAAQATAGIAAGYRDILAIVPL